MPYKNAMPDGYHLVWADEFNTGSLDVSSWNVSCHEPGWMNGELQAYKGTECVISQSDLVTILPKKTVDEGGNAVYVSSRIDTSKLEDFLYGRIVARIKVPRVKGARVYLSLLPTDENSPDGTDLSRFPASGRIDIMDIDGSSTDVLRSSVHFGNPHTVRKGEFRKPNVDFSADFHIFVCVWDQGVIKFFCDGEEYYRTSFWFSKEGEKEADYPAPFNVPFHIVAGVAVGGEGILEKPDDTTVFDTEDSGMQIDYIRVYQKQSYDLNVVRPGLIDSRPDYEGAENLIKKAGPASFSILNREHPAHVRFHEDEIEIVPPVTGRDYVADTSLIKEGLPVKAGGYYEFSFEACADAGRSITASIIPSMPSAVPYMTPVTVSLDSHWQTHRIFFRATRDDPEACIEIGIGSLPESGVHIRNMSFVKRKENDDRRKMIGVFGVWEDADNYSLFLRSLQSEETMKDFVIASFTFNTTSPERKDRDVELQFADFIGRLDLSAMIIFGEMIKTREVIMKLVQYGLEKKIPVFTFQYPQEHCINADFAYAEGFEKIVRHVIEDHGVRNTHFFAGYRGNSFSEERIEVYKKVLEEHGIPFDRSKVFFGDFWEATASSVLDDLFDSGYELPEAIICANDSMAIGVCASLKKHGYRIPEDVIVTGFDGIMKAQLHEPVITTGELDYKEVAKSVISRIREWTPEESGKTDSFLIRYKPLFQQSCGCKSSSDFNWHDIAVELTNENTDSFRHMTEMGRLVMRMTVSDNIDEASENLRHSLWQWQSQYYFVGITETGSCVHSVFHGRDGNYRHAEKLYRMKDIVPDFDKMLAKGSGINVLLFRQIETRAEAHGFIVNGYEKINQRSQQRFEEFALFVSATVNAVLNNRKLIMTNKAIEQISEQDFLTGLYNRRGFFAALDSYLNSLSNRGRILSLFSLDMDRLKAINDDYGHDNGDIAIQSLARALQGYVGGSGIAARYGGDEFAFAIITNEKLEPEVKEIRAKIEQNAGIDSVMQGKPFDIGVSIGISERVIGNDIDIEEMILEADARMYADKRARKRVRPD